MAVNGERPFTASTVARGTDKSHAGAPPTAQAFKMTAAANLYFDGVPGSCARLVAALRAVGGTRIGSTDIARAPLEVADSDVLDYADEIVVTADDWTAIIVVGELWSLSLRRSMLRSWT